MFSTRRSLTVGVLLFAPVLALAAQKPPKGPTKEPQKKESKEPPRLAPFLGKFDEAKTLAKERNVPLLLHIVLEGEPSNDEYRDKVLPDRDLVVASANAVVIVANNGVHAKKTIEVTAPDGTKEHKEVCAMYGTPNCGAHQRCWDDLFRDYHEDDGSMRCPQTIILLPTGEVSLRVNDGNPPEPSTIVGALEEARAKAGPGLTDAELVQVKQLIADGAARMNAKAWPEAVLGWRSLLAITAKGHWAQFAIDALPIAEKGLNDEFERLSALLVPGKAVEGYKALIEFQKACAGLPIEKEIAARVKKAETDKALKDEIALWKLGLEADAILTEAQRATDEKDEKRAARVVRRLFKPRYATTAAAAQARKLWPEIAAEEDAKQGK